MALQVTPGSGATVASDVIAAEHHQKLKMEFGVDGTATPVAAATPMPVREPPLAAALNQNGINATTSSGVLVVANAARQYIEIANGGSSGIWLHFGAAPAVSGQGSYIPAKATSVWAFTGEVRVIVETSGSGGPVGYVEW